MSNLGELSELKVYSYTQCELMTQHYKYPVLLIEFEEDKAFSLEVCLFLEHSFSIVN